MLTNAIFQQPEGGWWQGRIGDTEGWFPSKLVVLKPTTVEPKKSKSENDYETLDEARVNLERLSASSSTTTSATAKV